MVTTKVQVPSYRNRLNILSIQLTWNFPWINKTEMDNPNAADITIINSFSCEQPNTSRNKRIWGYNFTIINSG